MGGVYAHTCFREMTTPHTRRPVPMVRQVMPEIKAGVRASFGVMMSTAVAVPRKANPAMTSASAMAASNQSKGFFMSSVNPPKDGTDRRGRSVGFELGTDVDHPRSVHWS